MRRLILPLAVLGALALPVSATGQSVPLRWVEHAKLGGKRGMSFRVEELVFQDRVWVARVSFTNDSNAPITVGDDFSLALYRSPKTTDPGKAVFLRAVQFRPKRPTKLAPGQTWKGAFAGAGVPRAGVYVRVVFGRFSGGLAGRRGFDWFTDHAYRFQSPAKGI